MHNLITKLSNPVKLVIFVFMSIVLLAGCASKNAANVKNSEEIKLITDIITSEDSESTIVTVKGNRTLTYTANKQEFPLGVLFHFPETALDNIKTEYIPPENDTISSIRAVEIEEDGKASRIFIALKRDLPYDIKPAGPGLLISFPKTANLIAETTPQESQKEETEEIAVKTTAAPATRIISVSATPLKNNVVINVKADGTIKNFESFTIEETPSRIVIDMYNLKSPYSGEQRIAVKSEWVSRVRHFGHPDKIRMVLETKKAFLSKYSATPVDNGLLIYVGQVPTPLSDEETQPVVAEAQTLSQSQENNSPASETAHPELVKSQISEKTNPVISDPPGWLNRIDFSSEADGKSAIIVGTTRTVKYEIVKVTDKELHLRLLNTNLPEYRKRALITTRFQSAVDRVTPMQKVASDETIIVIELREAVPYFVKQAEDIITVNFSPSTIPPKPYEDAKLPAWKQVLVEPEKKAEKAAVLAQARQERTLVKDEMKLAKEELSLEERLAGITPEKRYTGEKIALDFYDTDIRNVFRIIREISGKNFAIDKNVTGKVTLALERPVPWDQVLDLILKMNQLGMTMEGDIIRIATLNTLAQEEKLKQAQLKAEQQALQQQKALEPLITEYIPCNYSDAKSEVMPHIKPILSDGRGKISVDTRNNQLIITDTAETILQAREIVKKIDQVTPQVIIEARIVEANASFTRDLGFDWGTISAGSFNIGDATLDLALLASNLPPIAPSGVIGATFQKLTGTPFSIIDAQLQASETEGKTNIISSPKVVTLDNKKARIKQGLEVPYLERDSSGNATVRFKNVDLLLEVSPNVTPDERIVMKIFITKNDVAEQTQAGPALSTNEAETELLVEDGDTIVIGGIVKSTITYGEKGIPGLRKVGVLGWLFKSQSKLDNKNELLIFITPRIVQLEQRANI